MNFSEILATIDTYAREYIRYVLSVTSRSTFNDDADDFDPKLINFSLISVGLGNFLFERFVRHVGFSQSDLIDRIVRVFSTWLFLGLVLYAGLNFRSRTKIAFNPSLSIVLRVMPVAFVVSTYAATIVTQLARLFDSDACTQWWGYLALSANEAVIIVVFLPIAVARYIEYDHASATVYRPRGHTFGRGRTFCLSLLVIAIVLSVRIFTIVGSLVANAPVVYVAEIKYCGKDRSCISRQSERKAFWDELAEIGGCF